MFKRRVGSKVPTFDQLFPCAGGHGPAFVVCVACLPTILSGMEAPVTV